MQPGEKWLDERKLVESASHIPPEDRPISIALTAIVAVAVTVYMTLVFFKIKGKEVDRLY